MTPEQIQQCSDAIENWHLLKGFFYMAVIFGAGLFAGFFIGGWAARTPA